MCDERHPLGNLDYRDLRGLSSDEVSTITSLETELVARVRAAAVPEDEMNAVDDELYEDPDGLLGLDLGVAGTVVALSAAGCIPITSCNGGVFGGHHMEDHPLVVFYAPVELVPDLLTLAEAATVGLENADGGALLLFAGDIDGPMAFAAALHATGLGRASSNVN